MIQCLCRPVPTQNLKFNSSKCPTWFLKKRDGQLAGRILLLERIQVCFLTPCLRSHYHCNSSSRTSAAPFWPPQELAHVHTHVYTHAHFNFFLILKIKGAWFSPKRILSNAQDVSNVSILWKWIFLCSIKNLGISLGIWSSTGPSRRL